MAARAGRFDEDGLNMLLIAICNKQVNSYAQAEQLYQSGKICLINMDHEDKQAIVREAKALYEQGATAHEVARRMNLSSRTVRDWAKRGFVVARHGGCRKKGG